MSGTWDGILLISKKADAGPNEATGLALKLKDGPLPASQGPVPSEAISDAILWCLNKLTANGSKLEPPSGPKDGVAALLTAVDALIIQRKLIVVTKVLGSLVRLTCWVLLQDLKTGTSPRNQAALRALSTATYERARGLSPEDRSHVAHCLAEAAPLVTAPFHAAPGGNTAEVPEDQWDSVLLVAQAASSLAVHHAGSLSPASLSQLASVASQALHAVWRSRSLTREDDRTARVLGGVLRALQILVSEGGAATAHAVPPALLENLRRLLVYGAATTQAALAASTALQGPAPLERQPSQSSLAATKPAKDSKGQAGMTAAQLASARAALQNIQQGKDKAGPAAKEAPSHAPQAPQIPDPFGSSRVRIAALMLIQSVAKELPETVVPLLSVLLPSHTDKQTLNPRPVAPTLATVLLFDPQPRARLSAAAALQTIMEAPLVREHVNIFAALRSQDVKRPPKMGFVPASELLGRTVVQVQVALQHALAKEDHPGVLAACCRALGSWAPLTGTGARRTPGGGVVVVRRLPTFLLPQAVESVFRCLIDKVAEVKYPTEGSLEGKAIVHKGREQATASLLTCLGQLVDRSAAFSAGAQVSTPSVPASPSGDAAVSSAPKGEDEASTKLWAQIVPALLAFANASGHSSAPYDVQCEAMGALRAAVLHPLAQRALCTPACLELVTVACRRNVAPFWSKEAAAAVGSKGIFSEDPRLAQASLRLMGAAFVSVAALPPALVDAPPALSPAAPAAGPAKKDRKGAQQPAGPAAPVLPTSVRLLQLVVRALKETVLPGFSATNETVAASSLASLAHLAALWPRVAEDGTGRALLDQALVEAVRASKARAEGAVRAAASSLLGSLAPLLVSLTLAKELPFEAQAAPEVAPAPSGEAVPPEEDEWATVAVVPKKKGGKKGGAGGFPVPDAAGPTPGAPGAPSVSFSGIVEALERAAGQDEHPGTRLRATTSLAALCDRARLASTKDASAAKPMVALLSDKAGGLFVRNFEENEKARPSCVRGLGNLVFAAANCSLSPAPSWMGRALSIIQQSLGEGAAKTRWNACYSVGLLLSGPLSSGQLLEHDAQGLVRQTLAILEASQYLKLRVNAAMALCHAVQRAHLQPASDPEPWTRAIQLTLDALRASESEASAAPPSAAVAQVKGQASQADWKRYRPALQGSLQQLLVRWVSMGQVDEAPDVDALKAVLVDPSDGKLTGAARWVARALVYSEGKSASSSCPAESQLHVTREAAVRFLAKVLAAQVQAAGADAKPSEGPGAEGVSQAREDDLVAVVARISAS